MRKAIIKGPRVSGAWLESAALQKVLAAFKAAGIEARIVGGAVRNSLIGRPVTDIDIATPALPEDVIRIARSSGLGAHPTGIAHGTITVVADAVPFEVTTLRRDVETDGRRAVVAFTSAWEDDASRRDFTINALYCSADGTVYDPVGGLADLRERRVRFIGDPAERIREDYLRILRFFRFAAEFGNSELDPAGLAAAKRLKDGLRRLSPERIRSEILKLLAGPKAAEIVRIMHAAGILDVIFATPLDPDCLARLQAIEAALGQPPDVLARLAALAVPDANQASDLAKRLRLSNAEAERLEEAARGDAAFDPAVPEAAAQAALYRMGADAYRRAVRVAWARSGAPANDSGWRARTLLPDRWKPPVMPFAGSDVVAEGVAPGPQVGAVLKSFENWWIASGFPDDKALQRAKLRELAKSTVG